MRLITAILVLAAAPAFSQTSGSITGSKLGVTESGSKAFVREYDGSKYNPMEGAFSLTTAADKTYYLDMGAGGLGNGEESGYFNLNLGSFLSVKSKLNTLNHRQNYQKVGSIINGQFISSLDRAVNISTSLVPLSTDYTRGADLSIKRVESDIRLVLSRPSNPDDKLIVGYWNERETGNFAAKYPNQVNASTVAEVNRESTDMYVGLNAGVGAGAISLEATQRIFDDTPAYWVALTSYSVSGDYLYEARVSKPRTPSYRMMLYDLRFRSSAGAPVVFTGALSARTRKADHTDYLGKSYAATVAAAYRPIKKLSVSLKGYGRAQGVHENDSNDFRDGLNKRWDGLSGSPKQQISHYNMVGDLNARYVHSEHLKFHAGYKYSNTYRQNTEIATEEFASDVTYADGTYISSYTQTNGTPERDIKKIVTFGFEAELPLHAELEASYRKMTADFAVFESMPTDQTMYDVTLNVPVLSTLDLVASADYMTEENKKSNLTDSDGKQTSYMGGLEWAVSRVNAGASYSYEKASYHSTGYFGMANLVAGYWLTNPMRVPDMLYEYTNKVYDYHAAVKVGGGISLLGSGSYTISEGGVPVNLGTWRAAQDTANVRVTNIGPIDQRTLRGSVGVKIANAADTLAARFTYRRDKFTDKYVAANTGTLKVMDAAVSLKF